LDLKGKLTKRPARRFASDRKGFIFDGVGGFAIF
jgi:hypothetical protein